MKRVFLLAIAAVFAFGISQYTSGNKLSADSTVAVASNDKQMNAAMQRARDTLDHYWKVAEKPGAGDNAFAIKVRIVDAKGAEHFWLSDVKRQGDGFAGLIANEPEWVKSVKYGQEYTFSKSNVSDWMYIHNSKIYGAFTIRVLAERIPKEQGDKFKSSLAYLPE